MISRRKFIRSSTFAGAGLYSGLSLGSLTGCTSAIRCNKPVKKHKYVLADIHNHLMLNDWNSRTPLAIKTPALDFITHTFFNKTYTNLKTAHEAGIDLICASHYNVFDEWVGMPTDPNPVAPANTMRMMDLLEEELAGPSANYAKLIRTPEEFKNHFIQQYDKNDANFRIAILHSLEGGHALGGSLEPLYKFAQRGVVLITISHFYNKGIASAPNPLHFFPDDNSLRTHLGLSSFGREVICEMEKLGIIVDVTHTTATALDDILSVSTKPLIATHTSTKTLGDHAISLHDEHIQEIVQHGGVIGIIFDPYWLSNYSNRMEAEKYGTLSEVVRTIRYVLRVWL
jgi:microsomal dipeptidase-like Zn-dependent dipeptidase